MNNEESNKEAKKIFDDWVKEKESIEKKAKKEGKWNTVGFDSNNHLFRETNKRAKEKLRELEKKIDGS